MYCTLLEYSPLLLYLYMYIYGCVWGSLCYKDSKKRDFLCVTVVLYDNNSKNRTWNIYISQTICTIHSWFLGFRINVEQSVQIYSTAVIPQISVSTISFSFRGLNSTRYLNTCTQWSNKTSREPNTVKPPFHAPLQDKDLNTNMRKTLHGRNLLLMEYEPAKNWMLY